MRAWLLLLTLFGLTSLIGCTRSVPKSSLKLQVPQNQSKLISSQATSASIRMTHIVVNVRGDGISPKIVWSWDADCGEGCMMTPPKEVSLLVPAGENRLIQFLGVYEDATNKSMFFSYGDALTSLSSGENSVDIYLTDFGSGSQEGMILGQYVTSTATVGSDQVGIGPTGKIEINFTAPSRPQAPMTVSSAEIFNGWFKFFAIEGVPFQYKLLPSGKVLNELDLKQLKESAIQNNPGNYSHLSMPNQYWSGTSDRRDSNGGEVVYGFFGPAASNISVGGIGAQACYVDAPSGVPLSNIYDAQTGGSNLMWQSNADPASPPTGNFYHLGGGKSDNGQCTASSYFKNKMYIDAYMDFENGKWELGKFFGPFRGLIAVPSFTTANCSSVTNFNNLAVGCWDSDTQKAEVHWDYINPEMLGQSNGISGVTVFAGARPQCMDCNSDDEFKAQEGEGYVCSEMKNMGLQPKFDLTDGITKSVIFDASFDPNQDQLVGFICPYKNTPNGRVYFQSAARIEFEHVGTGGGGTSGPLSVTYYGTTNDTDNDMYLIDMNSPTDPQVQWSSVSGAVNYEIEVQDHTGTGICAVQNTSSTSYTFSSCSIPDSGANQHKILIRAYDSNSNEIDSVVHSFYKLDFAPGLDPLSTADIGCGTWSSGSFIQFQLTVNHLDANKLEFFTEYDDGSGPSTNMDGNITPTTSTQTLTLNTGMAATGATYSGYLLAKACHASGYCKESQLNFSGLEGINCNGTGPYSVPVGTNAIDLSNLWTDAAPLGYAFQVSIDYTNDDNGNHGSPVLWWCNETASPGCDPLMHNSVNMNDYSTYFNVQVNLNISANDGDVIKFAVVPNDPDGYTGGPLVDQFTVNRVDTYITNFSHTNVTSNSFEAIADYSYDSNGNASAMLYYCNDTASSGCDPLMGDSMNMTKVSVPPSFSATTPDLSGSGYNPGDSVNYRIEVIDSDYVGPTSGQTNTLVLGAANTAALAFDLGTNFDFGVQAQGSVTQQILTITNIGSADATAMTAAIDVPFAFAGGSFPGGGSCGPTLAVSGSCTVVIEFAPISISSFNGNLTINYNDGVGAVNKILSLSGASGAPASLSASLFTHGFGMVMISSTSMAQSITIENLGAVDAQMTSQDFTAPEFQFEGGSYPGSSGDCGSFISPGSPCTISVVFTPNIAQTFMGDLNLNYDNGTGNTQILSIQFSGQGQ
jgi:hypothetical protein